ncbi:MAG TPA: hypothetical protein VII76_14170 [Acidimicrobiales bacterium]
MRVRLPGGPRRAPRPDTPDALAQRWRGQRRRLEVWYVTLTDPRTGLGCWIHHELVSPVSGDAHAHGWAAVFRPDAPPVLDRFGASPVSPGHAGRPPQLGGAAVLDPPSLRGETGAVAWDLRWRHDAADPSPPLFTFPAWAWERESLPAAQVVVVPSAAFEGTIRVGRDVVTLSPHARGAVSHIYGHGNAQRWGWLHAELGDGDVLEIVSAVSRRPGLNHLPALAFVQLRLGGRDWPRDPLAAAPLFRTRLGLPAWDVHGTVGRWRLRAEITIPEAGSVRVGYVDPDGAGATCVNSEIADAEIVLEHRRDRWEVAARWDLRAAAHAEIGSRP